MSTEPFLVPNTSLEACALWFTAPRTAEFHLETVPPPGPDEVRVRSTASALSQGTEMLVYHGEVPDNLPLDLPTLAGSFGFPIKYGYATIGQVIDVGVGVENLAPGASVFVHHPHQDFFVIPGKLAVRLPDELDALLGLFVANLETAVSVIHDTPLRLGETALVFGQGVLGLLITQLLKIAGAEQVLAVDPLKKRRDLALAMGADGALEPGDLPESILYVTAGRGADVAVEASGSGAALQAAIDSVVAEGTVVVASWYGTKPISLALGDRFHRERLRLRSSQVGRMSPDLGSRWDRSRRMEMVVNLLRRLRLKELISHRFPFQEAPDAYQLVDEHPEDVVQLILTHDRT
ncbi:MAG: zinc-binding alcohol dehydrogenase [Rubrobacter sp.]|nr:zinc-binding alcohol dehydrogenase [Rubrobacter sp.]